MIKRPLSMACLLFLIVQGLLLAIRGGQSLVEMPASSIFMEEEGITVSIAGQVCDKKITESSQILFLKNNSITYQNNTYWDSNIMVYDRDFNHISIGQYIKLQGTTKQFDIAHNPGNFDQKLYYARKNIYGAVYCEKIDVLQGETDSHKELLFQLKQKWKEKLIANLGTEKGNILAAMLLGEKSGMDEELKELYKKNGIGHVLAISGLHISFVGLGIYRLIRKTGLPFLAAGIVALSLLSLYAIMIGFSVSVFRAYVMLLLRILADVTGRIYDMMTGLMLAAALTVGGQPLYLTDAGFCLSYGAIIGILLVLPALEKYTWGQKKWFAVCASGIAVNLTLLPIQLWYYYELPIYSMLLNMIVIPLMSILLGAGMIGSVFLLFAPEIGNVLLCVSGLVLELYEGIGRIGLKLPGARIVTGQPEPLEIVFYYLVLIVILSGVCKKQWKKAVLCIVCGVMLFTKPIWGLQITMLDVGQGDGCFIKCANGINCFVDGGSSDIQEVGKYRIEPYLKFQGIGVLDYVFISHGDQDHYSGIEELIGRQNLGIQIKNLVLPENYERDDNLLQLAAFAQENDIAVRMMKAGTELKSKDLKIICLQPAEEELLEGNAGSMVLEVSYKGFQMLFTGDVEGTGEKRLMTKLEGKSYDVLKVAHHGSKYSTEATFLELIDPKIAIISAGADNVYGHPHQEVLERLKSRKIKILQTDESGAITIKTGGKTIGINVFH